MKRPKKFMFRNINEWREARNSTESLIKEDGFYIQSPEQERDIAHIVDSALEMGLDKEATTRIIRDIFTDPMQAPEHVSVNFVKDNLDNILGRVRETPDEQFATPIGYSEQMLRNSNPLESVFLSENASQLKDITGIVIEANIVYVPDRTKLSPVHNKRIIDFLKQNKTVNLNSHIKWARKTAQFA